MEAEEERIKAMVKGANQLSKIGKNKEALELLDRAFANAQFLPDSEKKQSLQGLICHYTGRIWQAMGRYEAAAHELQCSIDFRKNDSVACTYSVFQLFICKVYGNIPISDKEVEETKLALLKGTVDKSATIADIGNFLQNLAYVEQVKGDTNKAILFYKTTLTVREEAQDERGLALTKARLAEVYWKIEGGGPLAISYGKEALEFFKRTGDIERIGQVKKIFGWE